MSSLMQIFQLLDGQWAYENIVSQASIDWNTSSIIPRRPLRKQRHPRQSLNTLPNLHIRNKFLYKASPMAILDQT